MRPARRLSSTFSNRGLKYGLQSNWQPTFMNPKIVIVAMLAGFIAIGGYWKIRANQAAAEARMLEERARATKMEAEVERLKAEIDARDDSARTRMLERQQETTSTQQARELERNRALAEQVTHRNEAEAARFERQRLEAQRRAEDMQARRQAMESENDARQRAARDAQTIQAIENERINARRMQEQESLRQQQQQETQRRQQQQQYEEQRRRSMQGF